MKLIFFPGMDGVRSIFLPLMQLLQNFDCQIITPPETGAQDCYSLATCVGSFLPEEDFMLQAKPKESALVISELACALMEATRPRAFLSYSFVCKIIDRDIMRFKFFFVSILLMINLYGCSAPVIKPIDQSLNNTNSSIVHMVRPVRLVNGGVTYRVFINDEYIGPLLNGGVLVRRIKKGEKIIEFKPYELGIPSVGRKRLALSVEEGYKYSIVMTSNLGGITPIGGVIAVERTSDLSVTRESINQ